jgi:hypothetical protein
VLTDGAHMMALITAPDRPLPTDQAGLAAAFGSLLAYSGPYRVDGDRLVTDCDLAWHPAWVGTQQVRQISIDGDRLVLTSPAQAHPAYPGRPVRGVLAWQREA